MQFNRYIFGYLIMSSFSFMTYNYLDFKESSARHNDYVYTKDYYTKVKNVRNEINVYTNFVEALIFPISLPKKIIPYLN